jgi:nucleoside-diphosphate-sugar epimerase
MHSKKSINEKILITGAHGYIGSALASYCISNCINFKGSTRDPSNAEWEVRSPPLSKEANWAPLLDGCNIVIHTAARAHILNNKDRDKIDIYREINTDGTVRLAEQAAQNGIKRFIFLSSIGVNGAYTRKPFTAADVPQPIEPYAISKLEAEQQLIRLTDKYSMEVVIIRPPLVYGPNAPGNFGLLLKLIKYGIPLPFGSLTANKRTLISLPNLVDLIMTCVSHPAAANQIFLAGDDEDISTTSLLRRLALFSGKSPRLLPVPQNLLTYIAYILGKYSTLQRLTGDLQLDISKTRKLLEWSPPLTLDQGLRIATKNLKNETTV